MSPVPLTLTDSRALYQPVNRILDATAVLRIWHLSSFDAPTVAVVWSLAFGSAAGLRLPIWSPVLIALVVWTVYVGDRIMDAQSALRREQIHSLRPRHIFHWRHRHVFVPLTVVAAIAAGWIVLTFMPIGARMRNSLLAVAAGAYFSSVHSRNRPIVKLPKELLVAVLFTVGCALPTLGRTGAISAVFLLVIVFFVALAWLNCYAIEQWESAGRMGANLQIRSGATVLALAGLLGATVLFAFQPHAAILVVAGSVSALLLGTLDRTRSHLTPLALRVAADLVLLTPLVLLFR
jgi:hypothetical protein